MLTGIASDGQEQAAWLGHQFPVPVLLEDNYLVLTRQSVFLFLENRSVTRVSVPAWLYSVMTWLVHLYERLVATHCTQKPDISISSCWRYSVASMVESCWGFSVMIWTVPVCSFWQVPPGATTELNMQMILNFSAQEGMGANNLGQSLSYIKRFYTFMIGYCV